MYFTCPTFKLAPVILQRRSPDEDKKNTNNISQVTWPLLMVFAYNEDEYNNSLHS